jgi:surface polysaccharide O-acyltransferase-like enzyme
MVAKKYLFQADVVRVVAILGALAIHLMYPVYSRPDFFGGVSWWFAMLVNAIARTAIPLFVMLSGYLLLGKEYSLAQNLRRTFWRIGFPLLFWTATYFWWESYWFGKIFSWFDMGNIVLSGSVFNLYFLVILLNIYLALPILQPALAVIKANVKWYFGVGSLVVGILLYVAQYLVFRNFPVVNIFTFGVPYLGYFLLGYLLKNIKMNRQKWIIALSLLGGGFISTVVLTYLQIWLFSHNNLTFTLPSGIHFFDQYLSPNVAIMSVGLFWVLIQPQAVWNTWKNKVYRQAMLLFSQAAFGMYLIHSIVIGYLDVKYGFQIELVTGNLWLYLIKKSLLVIAICFVVITIWRRIPILNWLLGEKRDYQKSKDD